MRPSLSARGLALMLLVLAGFTPVRAAEPDPGQGTRKADPGVESPETALRRFTAAPGLRVDLFAAEPDVRNPVTFSIDEQGRVFVVESDRRRSSVFDIRGHADWLEADFSFRTVRERAEFLRQQVSPAHPGVIQRLTGGGRGTFADFNRDGVIDWRDLEIQSERLRLLEDTDRDGRADRVRVFADGFTNIVAGVAAGVLAHRDELWFACIPDLWKWTNVASSGTGPAAGASGRRVGAEPVRILSGFGVHVAFGGHDMHGLILGPDGKLYWSIADRGTDTNLFARLRHPVPGLTPELLADSGCVFRANPDGTDLEVIAWGLRNPQELAFDEHGNLFTADNNGDGGDKARWHHVVEGADFGWRLGWQWLEARAYQPKMGPWNGERLWHLAASNSAAYLLPPLAHIGHGPAGLAFNPGTGLPSRFDGHFFLCDFPGHVLMWTNIPDGASFRAGPVQNFFGDLGPTDVAFHPDGGVLVSDWFKSFDKSDKGRLYRVHDPATDRSVPVQETRRLLEEGMTARPAAELAGLLGHADLRVRLEAQWELAARVQRGGAADARAALFEAAHGQDRPRRARVHAIWALGMSLRDGSLAALDSVLSGVASPFVEAAQSRQDLFADGSPEVRAAAWTVWGAGAGQGGAALSAVQLSGRLSQLRSEAMPQVRREAMAAVGKVLQGRGADPVGRAAALELLRWVEVGPETTSQVDPYLQHAAALALARIGDQESLVAAAAHRSPAVRLCALLALRRLGHPEVARFLGDPDRQIVLEAARAIHDVPIPGAMPRLAALVPADPAGKPGRLLEPGAGETAFFTLRRALNANFRLGHLTNAQALAALAARDGAPEPLRLEALELLRLWPKPPARDHFLGLWRPLPAREAGLAAGALRPVLPTLLGSGSNEVRVAAVRAAAVLGVPQLDLFGLVADRSQPPGVRAEALRVLAERKDARLPEALRIALGDSSETLRLAATRLQGGSADVAQLTRTLAGGTIAEQQSALAVLAVAPAPAAGKLVAGWLDRLLAGRVPKELELDVLEAARQRVEAGADPAALRQRLRTGLDRHQAALPKDDLLAGYRSALLGGNAAMGRTIFVENQLVACFRCHKIQGEGGDVGPELTGLGAKQGREYLLESILFPNRHIAPGYENVTVTLKNGQSYAGQVKASTDRELRLLSPEDGPLTIAVGDIAERRRGLSAMPEDLGTFLTRRELRDLIEFLAGLK